MKDRLSRARWLAAAAIAAWSGGALCVDLRADTRCAAWLAAASSLSSDAG